MLYVLLSISRLGTFIERIHEMGYEVYAPKRIRGKLAFARLRDGELPELEYINTDLPPKEFYRPQEEVLFWFKPELKVPAEFPRIALFGVRPCDVNAIYVLDRVLEKDELYRKRRHNLLLICMECTQAGENCFCDVLGTSLPRGADIVLAPIEEGFLVKADSEKGKKILETCKDLLEEAEFRHITPSNFNHIISRRSIEKLPEIFEHEIWDKLAETCISCGVCSEVCPTCFCFGIEDTKHYRKRFLMPCLLFEFGRTAQKIYRPKLSERIRHFVFHKLYYNKKNFGLHLCVGCGRCAKACPVGINFYASVEEVLGNGNGASRG